MRATKRVLTIIIGLLGVALVVKGATDGLWPVAWQLIAGLLLLVYAVLRWRTL